ncbi:MAG TPA: hypothetical protein VF092_00675 [Longimicrobium sp.]
MSCCGGNRRAAASPPRATTREGGAAPEAVRIVAAAPESVAFEYTGGSALSAVGPFTGRRYRFAAPGAVVAVDRRDAAALAAVPNLRRATVR